MSFKSSKLLRKVCLIPTSYIQKPAPGSWWVSRNCVSSVLFSSCERTGPQTDARSRRYWQL